jgi:hypothetical protein
MSRKAFTSAVLCATGCMAVLASGQTNEAAEPAKDLGSYCGIYCGKCPKYIDGKCPGCKEAVKSECKIRACGEAKGIKCCTECKGFPCPKTEALHTADSAKGKMAAANCKVIKEVGYDQWLSDQAADKKK